MASGLEVIKLEYSLRFKIKRNGNDWLLAEMCLQESQPQNAELGRL